MSDLVERLRKQADAAEKAAGLGNEDCRVCPTCKGDGRVNPLTAPAGFLCLSATDCPDCEGKGYVE